MNSEEFTKRLVKLKAYLGLNKGGIAEALGCSRTMVYHYEQGTHDIPSDVKRKLLQLEATIEHDYDNVERDVENTEASKHFVKQSECRDIPVIGMAHAGEPLDFEETPESWQESIATECRDKDAFGCKIIGDSMSPAFEELDVLVLMPNEEIYSGCFGVAKFEDGGVLFRRFSIEGERITAIPSNARYPLQEYKKEDFAWIYPVYESRRYLWRGNK